MKRHLLLGTITGAILGLAGCGEKTANATVSEIQTETSAQWPRIASRVARDEQLEKKVEALLARMSDAEKVGQIIQAELKQVTPQDVRDYHLGSVLNGGGSFPDNDKYARLDDWVALADEFYRASTDTADGGVAIPVIWGTDAVHGHNNVIGATLFPHNIALGAARNPQLMREIGAATAREVAATGIDWAFAPTLAVVQDDRWGRTYESFSEDPSIVASYGGPLVEGLQGDPEGEGFLGSAQVIATAKHFIADGGTRDGIDRGDVLISEEELLAIHAPGYFTALERGAQTVMASFSSWQGRKLHGHKYLLTDVLKERMGFDGFVIGDWNGHAFVDGCSVVSCPQAINAGLDMFMAAEGDWKQLYANTLRQVQDGRIPGARLDDAVRRILRVKIRAGMFDKRAPSTRPLAGDSAIVGAPEHRAIARRAVRESLVLLKNRDHLLPLARNQRVLVAGDGADNIGKQAGGWTISWQGTGNRNSDFPGATSIYRGIVDAVESAGGEAILSEDGSFATKPDVALVVFGENPYAEMQGDIPNLSYKYSERDLALLKKLRAQNIPVASLFITGRPLWVNREINASDAFAVIWQPGSEGAGVADVIFRKADGSVNYDFTGRLPFTWPQTAAPEDSGVQYAFDFGLDYDTEDLAGLLPEDSGLGERQLASELKVFEGRPMEPWSLQVTDIGNKRRSVDSSVTELEGIRVQAVDRNVQEDSRRLTWDGSGVASVGFFANRRTDLSAYLEAGGALVFDVKVDRAPSADVRLGMNCGTGCTAEQPISDLLRDSESAQWRTVSVALQCLVDGGAQLDMLLSPFYLVTDGAMDISLNSIRVASGVEADIHCG
ncbi:glycoside hydrolase family 3 protein [Microbulbifer taiwanensis]|uniref:Exo 1,3/1,4-beta-D-glucan glucohydrolase n=2 Tax=Microbulbifer taiwanensis TaxID=986746 RepID=A0ABW1YKJ5_9GAMM|nr:glycoside hydrolase family 3 N-terminal domain-containing protein [Microbulbifer taiwanensis]